MSGATKRLSWLDMAKGYGMIAIILGHILFRGPLRTWLYSFHIPLFFFLSGFVFHSDVPFGKFLKKKSKSLLLPYLYLGMPMLVFILAGHYFVGDFTAADYRHYLTGFFFPRRLWTLWFLTVLFFLNVMFYAAFRSIRSEVGRLLFALACTVLGLVYYRLGGGALLWDIDICFPAALYFFAGYEYKCHQEKVDGFIVSKRWLALPCTLALNLALCLVNLKLSGKGVDMFEMSYGVEPLTYLAAFAGIGFVVTLSKMLTIRPVESVGRNSIVYFAWHQYIMIPVSAILLSKLRFAAPVDTSSAGYCLYIIVQLAIILLMLAVCAWVVRKIKEKCSGKAV